LSIRRHPIRLPPAALLLLPTWSAGAEDLPSAEALEAADAVIGEIVIDRQNIFDLSDPEENNWLYRMANRLHIVTQKRTIQKQLLFKSGDPLSAQLLEESGRILRQRRYLYTAEIEPVSVEDGVVDVAIHTRDVWSLFPDLTLSRSGGENTTEFGLEEENLLGLGQQIRYSRSEDVDRTSNAFEFIDPHVAKTWVSATLGIADNSDGFSNLFSAIRPFYALDTRNAGGVTLLVDDRRTRLYELGDEVAEFQHRRDFVDAFFGWSPGLEGRYARRFTIGAIYDDNDFSEARDQTLPQAVPDDRRLVYPYVGFELVEDKFRKGANRDQMGRIEDFRLGKRVAVTLGWSDERLGADRDALIYTMDLSRSYGEFKKNTLLVAAGAEGRLEDGEFANARASFRARYYRRQGKKRLFFVTVQGTIGDNLDLDRPIELGGDTGLRGYPLRYQAGDAKALLTIEERYYFDWYPFRLFRVGGAVFFDIGRTWGENQVGGESLGWLRDLGFGLRFQPTRGKSSKVLHLDIAFPLDGDESIDSVQILLEAKRGF